MMGIHRSICYNHIEIINSKEDFLNRADSLEAELMETARFEMVYNEGKQIWNSLQRAYGDAHEGNIGISREWENWSYFILSTRY